MTNDDPGPTTQALPVNVNGVLNAIYQGFKNGDKPVSGGPGSVRIVGSNVGVSIRGNGQGDFSAFVDTLQNLGMEVASSSDAYWLVNGMLPISQLPTAAQTPQTLSIMPAIVPKAL